MGRSIALEATNQFHIYAFSYFHSNLLISKWVKRFWFSTDMQLVAGNFLCNLETRLSVHDWFWVELFQWVFNSPSLITNRRPARSQTSRLRSPLQNCLNHFWVGYFLTKRFTDIVSSFSWFTQFWSCIVNLFEYTFQIIIIMG